MENGSVAPFEGWMRIRGCNRYLINNIGIVKRTSITIKKKTGTFTKLPEMVIRPWLNQQGYYLVSLVCDDGNERNKTVHRAVLEAFTTPPDYSLHINHKDGNKTNNNIFNLEWCTQAENVKHAYSVLGRKPSLTALLTGQNRLNSKLKESDLYELFSHLKSDGSLNSFAKQKGVSTNLLRHILKGNIWKHIRIDWKDAIKDNKYLRYSAVLEKEKELISVN